MFYKAPSDVLDYKWDWSVWLPEGDAIDTVSWTVPAGIEIPDLNAPVNLAATASETGGTLAAGAYFYKVTTINEGGETTPSGEASATISGDTGSVVLAWDADSIDTGAKIYRGTTAGGEDTLVATLTEHSETYTDIGATGTDATVPDSNTASAVSQTDTSATVFISSGTAGTGYDITCQISTKQGRIGQNTQPLNVVDL